MRQGCRGSGGRSSATDRPFRRPWRRPSRGGGTARESGGCCCCPVRWGSQVFAVEKLVVRDEAVLALPIVGDERPAFDADFGEEACGCITVAKNPGDGSPKVF